MRTLSRLGLALLGLPCLLGCGNSEDSCRPAPSAPSITLAELSQAPDSLVLQGRRFGLDLVAYRNAQPSPFQERRQPLVISCDMEAIGTSAFPESMHPSCVWAINSKAAWSSTLQRSDELSLPANVRRYFASCGPEWTVGSSLDIILGVADSDGVLHPVITRGLLYAVP